MAQRSFPHDSVDGDRQLDTQQWARLTAALAGDGVVPGLGDEMAVVTTAPESLAVRVSVGDYLIQGRHFQVHSEPETVTLDTAHATNPRVDRIVVRRDMAARTVTVGKITGTPAVSPTVPALTRNAGGVWEDPLRRVFVRANATTVRASDLNDGQGYLSTDERRRAQGGLVPGRGWVPLTSGFAAGPVGHVDVSAVEQFPGGTFERLRLTVAGRIAPGGDPEDVGFAVNNDNTAGLHLAGYLLRRASDGALVEANHTETTFQRAARWSTITSCSFQVEFNDTHLQTWVSWRGVGQRPSATPGAHQESVCWGRVQQERLVTSFRVRARASAEELSNVRWYLEGYRP